MNTNPTAISLAVITNSLQDLYDATRHTEASLNAFLTGLDAVHDIAAKNGNSVRNIDEIANTLKDSTR